MIRWYEKIFITSLTKEKIIELYDKYHDNMILDTGNLLRNMFNFMFFPLYLEELEKEHLVECILPKKLEVN